MSCPELNFFAVIDGMGGLPASMRVIEELWEALPKRLPQATEGTTPYELYAEAAAEILKATVENVSNELFRRFNVDPFGVFCGATLVCAWLVRDKAVFAGLGDCRGYLFGNDNREIRQITEDHNAAAALVKNGTITKAEAMSHPAASRLDRFAGMPGCRSR